MSECALALCVAVVSSFGYKTKTQERVQVCQQVVEWSQTMGVDASLSLSVASVESGFRRGLRSSAGAVGPMQVMRQFWCRKNPCNLVESGVFALKTYTERHGTKSGLCYYSTGSKCSKKKVGLRYAKKVLRNKKIIDSLVRSECVAGC
tara:strand:- start:66 stop:509 length:444 start_codon:yes stop_codon:yes gene_type:complete